MNLPDTLSLDFLIHNWLTVDCIFKAQGNEKVLVLGAGSTNDYEKIINSNLKKYSYKPFGGPYLLKYFIDNVNLIEFDSNKTELTLEKIDSLKIGQSIILANIYFEFDKYILLKESFPTLDQVADYLVKYPKIHILISGHTDNIGSDKYNIDLSNKRARSIVDYLIKKSISQNRLESVGLGSRFPVDSNKSESGRLKNRRIEIKIVEK